MENFQMLHKKPENFHEKDKKIEYTRRNKHV